MDGLIGADGFADLLLEDLETCRYRPVAALDATLQGAVLGSDDPPPVGTEQVLFMPTREGVVGCLVRVLRHGPRGLYVEFVDPRSSFLMALTRRIAGR